MDGAAQELRIGFGRHGSWFQPYLKIERESQYGTDFACAAP
jgi:hypothetical protein